ncbi:hypothetical protein ACSBR2_004884 [Camellia fascicularis]
MASNGQKEKIGDDALTGSDAPIDLDIEGDNHNTGTNEQAKKRGTLARLATHQGSPIRVDITKKTTSRYGRTDAYGGTRK